MMTQSTNFIISLAVSGFVFLVLLSILIASFISNEKIFKDWKKDHEKKKKTGNSTFRGELGESLVDEELQDICDFRGGYAYKELKLENENGNWTEIDNIYISPYGVFFIETKNIRGKIIGFLNDEKWTQVIGKKKAIYFSNPVMQNRRHIAFFMKMFPEVKEIIPLVVFVNPDELNVYNIKEVITLNDLDKVVSSKKVVYSKQMVEHINSLVKEYVINPPFTHEEYRDWIRSNFVY